MFERATATADRRHRAFFGGSDMRQVWAREPDGSVFYLHDGAVSEEIRAAARSGRLSCPYPGCPDSRFIAKGGRERRHHFAHRVGGHEHGTGASWRHQALLMLDDWCARRHPHLERDLDDHEDGDSLRLRSPASGKVVRLTVTYDRIYQASIPAPGEQLLLGHSRGLLLPRREAHGAPRRWWCAEGRLVGDLLSDRAWALAVNPEERLIATIAYAELAREARLITQRSAGPLLLLVYDGLQTLRLDADGLHTPPSDAIDEALKRRRAAEAERHRLAEAHSRALQRLHAAAPEPALWQASTAVSLPARTRHPAPWPERSVALDAAARGEDDWPRDVRALRGLLGDDQLAYRVEQPLDTDVECSVPVPVWHLMAVLEARNRGENPHPAAVRAAIVGRCGYSLTATAIAGVLAVAGGDVAARKR